MATRIIDIIEPEVFSPYLRESIIEKSALIKAGIVSQNASLDKLVQGGGRTVNMPFWKRLGGEDEILSDTFPLIPEGIGTERDIACMHLRGKAWSANELASVIAGDSAIAAIASMVTDWWLAREQQVLLSTLQGVFDSPTMADTNVLDRSSETICAEMTLDARQLLGDAATELAAIILHSRTLTELKKQNMVDYIPNARGEIDFPTYQGLSIVVDDTIPVQNGVYSTYIMAKGAIGRGDGVPVDLTPVEVDRDSLQGTDFLIHRRAFVLHPMGVSWVGNALGTTPTNAELRVGTNWERVYHPKNLGFVLVKHRI